MHRVLTHTAFWKGVAGAALGLIVGLLALHAWTDHQALHAISTYLNDHAPQINALPK